MKVLLSIKPEFVKRIFSGEKKFEYRRRMFKKEGISTVVVYASAPVSMVVGEFEIEKILFNNLDKLWNETNEFSGIDKEYFYKYFNGKHEGYAIQIKRYTEYAIPLDLKSNFAVHPPQSFIYIKQN